ncbi:MAG: hypothetical protein IPJ33_16080 [Gammaproteobacteria bacterium]|jgi:hypothetical protein|nr:hypothetical protein [Gammaproteobacteria bacterium]MBP6052429.1 hypothetical protein [Pseudomonadales bacterium]MBK6583169.1 hypothetical protein [Gammaproteobacteria bacterium]MBK7170632.1 hypothetical protein [Gammaproteobacteria bacterium]MBK7519303.1 hypothetical protein [Gammaproteobacteria bacterium]
MKTRLLVSAAVCALALGSVNTYAGNFGHGYGNNGGKDNFSKFEKFKGFDQGKKFDKFKDWDKRDKDWGKGKGNCGSVPEIDAASGTLGLGLTAGLIALLRGRRRTS